MSASARKSWHSPRQRGVTVRAKTQFGTGGESRSATSGQNSHARWVKLGRSTCIFLLNIRLPRFSFSGRVWRPARTSHARANARQCTGSGSAQRLADSGVACARFPRLACTSPAPHFSSPGTSRQIDCGTLIGPRDRCGLPVGALEPAVVMERERAERTVPCASQPSCPSKDTQRPFPVAVMRFVNQYSYIE